MARTSAPKSPGPGAKRVGVDAAAPRRDETEGRADAGLDAGDVDVAHLGPSARRSSSARSTAAATSSSSCVKKN
jgi:hypothetical protein